MPKNETPPGVAGLAETSLLAGFDDRDITPKPHEKQVPSPAVAAAVRRAQRKALLTIKRGSIWAIAIEADSHLASLIDVLEEDGEVTEIFPCAKIFIEHARAVAALATDFEAERRGRRS